MSSDRVTVATYEDLEDADLTSSEADDVARALRAGVPVVAVVESWAAEDKTLDGLGRHESLFAGTIDRETPKAWLLAQNGEEYQDDWLPKSVTTLYESAPDADLTIPQTTLGGGQR